MESYSATKEEEIMPLAATWTQPEMIMLSKASQSCPTLCDPMDYNQPGSFVHGFSRQKYWSGLPFPAPGDLPDPGIEPMSLAWQADSLLSLIMQSKVENRHSRQNNTETKPHILYNLNCEFVHKSFLFT